MSWFSLPLSFCKSFSSMKRPQSLSLMYQEKHLTSGAIKANSSIWTALYILGDTGSFHSKRFPKFPTTINSIPTSHKVLQPATLGIFHMRVNVLSNFCPGRLPWGDLTSILPTLVHKEGLCGPGPFWNDFAPLHGLFLSVSPAIALIYEVLEGSHHRLRKSLGRKHGAKRVVFGYLSACQKGLQGLSVQP